MKGGGPSVVVITEENKAEGDIATDRLKELMGDLLQMRKRLKKEEENRRQF